MQFLAQYLPRDEHFLAQESPPPPGMSTFWLNSTGNAVDIRVAFLFLVTYAYIYCY